MSQRSGWRRHFCGQAPDSVLRSWLIEPDSLTARCQRLCGQFRVRLLRQGRAKSLADEGDGRALVRVREVVLECDGIPVIFAHTTLSASSNGRLTRWLARLGNRSLGSLLFAYPGFRRGDIEFYRLDRRHPLFCRAAELAGGSDALWARRSSHRLAGQSVLVTEVFLPAIRRLSPGR
nr:chorismate lyase [Dechloromonas sp.]